MNIKDLRNLMEAYSEVHAPIDEATAMAKRGYDEAPIRQKIAKSTSGGESADRASALEKKSTFGDANKAKQRTDYARKQRGDFRKTTSSSPGLHGYAYKSDDVGVKAKQAARGAQRGALTPAEKKQLNREELDIFDVVLEFLQAEGFAETLEEAEWLMANVIDEEAIGIILGEDSRRTSNKQHTARVRSNIKSFGSNYTPPRNYDPDANRGQGEVLTRKQIEKKRRKSLRQEEFVGEEQLNELSDRKLRAYIKKSDKSHAEINKKWDQGTATDKEKNKSIGHEIGQRRAFKTLDKRARKEEFEAHLDEAQVANRDPEKYEREQSKKSAPVRGEKTPMPPRGDKRREDFEKWYAANVR